MALIRKKDLLNFTTLFILYFVQAMPFGFQSRYLPLVMRKQGASITSLGLFKLLLVPWIFKVFLAAFLIDVYKTKRFWLSFSMIVLTIGSFIGIFLEDFTQLSYVIFLLNWASASQDICVDWFAMNILKEEDLGIGNTIQVSGFKLGTLFSGGLLVYLSDYVTVSTSFLIFGCVYLLSLLLINASFLKSETKTDIKHSNEEKEQDKEDKNISFKERVFILFESPGTIWICLFVLVYKLGEQSSLNLLPIFLFDHKIPSSVIGLWTGIYGQTLSIIGSFLAGVLIKITSEKLPPIKWLNYTLILRVIPICAITYLVVVIKQQTSLKINDFVLNQILYLILIQLFLSGFLTTITFTLMMNVSFMTPKKVQATHFSLLATCEVFGKLILQPIISLFTEYYGYSAAFILFSFLYFSCLILYAFHPKDVFIKSKIVNKKN